MKVKKIDDSEKVQFYDDFIAQLEKYSFGSLQKRDLDCLLFHLFDKYKVIEGETNRDKSYNLGINLTRLNSYITDSNVKFASKSKAEDSVLKILEKLKNQKNVTFEDGVFIFSEENPVLRNDFTQAMKDKGFYTDTSHNKEIIKVKAVALLEFIIDGKDFSIVKDLIEKSDLNNEKLKNYLINQKDFRTLGKEFLSILKESQGDAIKLLADLSSFGLEIWNAKVK